MLKYFHFIAKNIRIIKEFVLSAGEELFDPSLAPKIRVLNIFLSIFIITDLLLSLLYYQISAVPLFWVTILAAPIMAFAFILLRSTKNFTFTGNYTLFIFWSFILLIGWNTGAVSFEGIINPAWILNVVLIFLAIFWGHYTWGVIWAVFVIFETGLMIILHRNGYPFPNLIPPDLMSIYSLGTYLIALFMTLIMVFLFEKDKSEALRREKDKANALQESKRYIDDILKKSPIPTFIVDQNHRVIQWNQACSALSGVSAEEALGKPVWEGFHINGHSMSLADMILQEPTSIEKYFKNKPISKTEFGWFELELFFPKLKHEQHAVVTASPIKDRHGKTKGAIQTIQTIRQQNEDWVMEDGLPTFQSHSFPTPIFRIDSRGKIDFWTKACEKNFGYTSDQMIGQSPLVLVSKSYRETFKKTVTKVLQGHAFSNLAWKYRTPEGKAIYIIARAYPILALNGRGRECVITNTDITDLKLKLLKLERHAVKSNEKLRNLSDEYDLLKKNIAAFIRPKDNPQK